MPCNQYQQSIAFKAFMSISLGKNSLHIKLIKLNTLFLRSSWRSATRSRSICDTSEFACSNSSRGKLDLHGGKGEHSLEKTFSSLFQCKLDPPSDKKIGSRRTFPRIWSSPGTKTSSETLASAVTWYKSDMSSRPRSHTGLARCSHGHSDLQHLRGA